jgi:aryl-alcohol dehydrogenase-like predicted oxidoreductase
MRYTTIGNGSSSARKVSVLSLGTHRFGTMTDEATSFAILDRYVEAGGNFIDTSNNYLFTVNGTQGGESEALLGRWRASRGIGDEIVIATKVGARPLAPATDFNTPLEGLSRAAIREASERSRERLRLHRLDLYYAHVPDTAGVPLDEQVAAFGELVAEGAVGLLGLSNHWSWQVERARRLAAGAGSARADVLQYHHTYLRMRTGKRYRPTHMAATDYASINARSGRQPGGALPGGTGAGLHGCVRCIGGAWPQSGILVLRCPHAADGASPGYGRRWATTGSVSRPRSVRKTTRF